MNPIVSASAIIDVQFFDVDAMHVVWHGNYLKYFEIARCALLDKINYNYFQMRESGYQWPIIDAQIRYIRGAEFGQQLRVDAHLVEYENRLKIDYLVSDHKTAQRLTRGSTVQVAVKMPEGEMCLASPRILLEKLGLCQK